jgi:hypothetical protein
MTKNKKKRYEIVGYYFDGKKMKMIKEKKR